MTIGMKKKRILALIFFCMAYGSLSVALAQNGPIVVWVEASNSGKPLLGPQIEELRTILDIDSVFRIRRNPVLRAMDEESMVAYMNEKKIQRALSILPRWDEDLFPQSYFAELYIPGQKSFYEKRGVVWKVSAVKWDKTLNGIENKLGN
jgi:hypothetical protein